MDAPPTDQELEALAETFLAEEELSTELATDAVGIVRSVTESKIWKRASKAKDRLIEVPYTYLKSGDPIPVLEPGVMDLVFKEGGGWIIVDYKTGRMAPEKYQLQLEAYRDAWETMGCGKVKEIGLYFVDHGEYVKL